MKGCFKASEAEIRRSGFIVSILTIKSSAVLGTLKTFSKVRLMRHF
jgi:hypothetical protein